MDSGTLLVILGLACYLGIAIIYLWDALFGGEKPITLTNEEIECIIKILEHDMEWADDEVTVEGKAEVKTIIKKLEGEK